MDNKIRFEKTSGTFTIVKERPYELEPDIYKVDDREEALFIIGELVEYLKSFN